MATYKDLVGTGVVNFAGNDPAAAKGQLWYNSSAYVWRYQFPAVTTTGSWRTGNNMNTPTQDGGGSGIYTAALHFGGYNPSGGDQTKNESYDGTSWTEVADLNTSTASNAGFGIQTSSVSAGSASPGYTANTELWNGSNWTEVNNQNVAVGGKGFHRSR